MMTPLTYAVVCGNFKGAKVLLEYGANPDGICDKDGKHLNVNDDNTIRNINDVLNEEYQNRENRELVSEYCSYIGKYDKVNNRVYKLIKTPLWCAVNYSVKETETKYDQKDMIKLLFRHGATVKHKDDINRNINVLYDNIYATLNSIERANKSPLYLAAISDKTDLIYMMINHEHNVNILIDIHTIVTKREIQEIINEENTIHGIQQQDDNYISRMDNSKVAPITFNNADLLKSDNIEKLNAFVRNLLRNGSDKRKYIIFDEIYKFFADAKGLENEVTNLMMASPVPNIQIRDIYSRVSDKYRKRTRTYANHKAYSVTENASETNDRQKKNNEYMDGAMISLMNVKMGMDGGDLNKIMLTGNHTDKFRKFRENVQKFFYTQCDKITGTSARTEDYIRVLELARLIDMMDYMYVPKVVEGNQDEKDRFIYKGHHKYRASLLTVLNDFNDTRGGNSGRDATIQMFQKVYQELEDGVNKRSSPEYFKLKILYAKLLPTFVKMNKTQDEMRRHDEMRKNRDNQIGGGVDQEELTKMMLGALLWHNPLENIDELQSWFHMNMMILNMIWEEFYDENMVPRYARFYDVMMESNTFQKFLELLISSPYGGRFKPKQEKMDLIFCDPKYYLSGKYLDGIEGLNDDVVKAIQFTPNPEEQHGILEPFISVRDVYSDDDETKKKIEKIVEKRGDVKKAINKLREIFEEVCDYREFLYDDEVAPITNPNTGQLCTIMIVHLLNLIVDNKMRLMLTGGYEIISHVQDWYYGIGPDEKIDENIGIAYILGHFVSSYRLTLSKYSAHRGRLAGRAAPEKILNVDVDAATGKLHRVNGEILEKQKELMRLEEELKKLDKEWEGCMSRYRKERRARNMCKEIWEKREETKKKIEEIKKELDRLKGQKEVIEEDLKKKRIELYKKEIGIKGDIDEDKLERGAIEMANLMEDLEDYKEEKERLKILSEQCHQELRELENRARVLERSESHAEHSEVMHEIKEKDEMCEKIKRKIERIDEKITLIEKLKKDIENNKNSGEDKVNMINGMREKIKDIEKDKEEEKNKNFEKLSVKADGSTTYYYNNVVELFKKLNEEKDPVKVNEIQDELSAILGSSELHLENLIAMLQGRHTSMMMPDGERNMDKLFNYEKYLKAMDPLRSPGERYDDMMNFVNVIKSTSGETSDTSDIKNQLNKINEEIKNLKGVNPSLVQSQPMQSQPMQQVQPLVDDDDNNLISLVMAGGSRRNRRRNRTLKDAGMKFRRIRYSVGGNGELLRTTVGGYLKQKGGFGLPEGLFSSKKPSKTIVVDKEKFLKDLRNMLERTTVVNEENANVEKKTEGEKMSDMMYNKRYAEMLELLRLSLKIQQHRYIPGYMTDLFNMVSQMHEMAVARNANKANHEDLQVGGREKSYEAEDWRERRGDWSSEDTRDYTRDYTRDDWRGDTRDDWRGDTRDYTRDWREKKDDWSDEQMRRKRYGYGHGKEHREDDWRKEARNTKPRDVMQMQRGHKRDDRRKRREENRRKKDDRDDMREPREPRELREQREQREQREPRHAKDMEPREYGRRWRDDERGERSEEWSGRSDDDYDDMRDNRMDDRRELREYGRRWRRDNRRREMSEESEES